MISTPLILGLLSATTLALNKINKRKENFSYEPKQRSTLSNDISLNDQYLSSNIIWSSNKINSLYVQKTLPISENNIVIFNSDGSVKDLNIKLDDRYVGPNIIWSSEKTMNTIPTILIDDAIIDKNKTWSSEKLVEQISVTTNSLQPRDPSSTEKNVAVFDIDGATVDSGYTIDDNLPATYTNLWSSQKIIESLPLQSNIDNSIIGSNLWDSSKINTELVKISTNVQPLGSKTSEGHLSVFDANGILIDGMMKVDDTALASPNILWSSQKISNSIPLLDDGIISTSSAWSSSQIVDSMKTKIDKILGVTNKLASFKDDGNIQSSGFQVNDMVTDLNTLWTSGKIQQMVDLNYQKIAVPVTENSIAVLNSAGQVTDSGLIINDTLEPSIDVIWSSKKLNDSFIPISQITNTNPNFLLSFDQNNKVSTNFVVDDTAISSPNVLWSSEKILNTKQTKFYASGFGTVILDNFSFTISSVPFLMLSVRSILKNTTINITTKYISSITLSTNVFKKLNFPITTTDYVPIIEGINLETGDVIENFIHDIESLKTYKVITFVQSTNILNSFISIELM